jgi:hypothetical protein
MVSIALRQFMLKVSLVLLCRTLVGIYNPEAVDAENVIGISLQDCDRYL